MSATVTVSAQPLWRIRLVRLLPRYALYALCIWGVLASARYAIAPPRPLMLRTPQVEAPDRAAEAFACLFARRYLSWNAAAPQPYEASLVPLVGEGSAATMATQLPSGGSQRAQWVQIVQEQRGALGGRLYTVAAQTDSEGLLYISVGVLRERSGALALAGYPAFVGAPASAPADDVVEGLRDVQDAALVAVLERALRNYLADDASQLAADLTEAANVSLPTLPLTLDGVEQLKWLPAGGSVLAELRASDGRGARYTLAYQLEVARVSGRWEVSAIETDRHS